METENEETTEATRESTEQESTQRYSNILQMWQVMNLNSKIMLSAVLILIVMGIILSLTHYMQPTYTLLFGGLDLKDSSVIVQELDSQNVPYRLKSGGRDIYVPLKHRDTTRLNLAGKGLPATSAGYELLDRNQMTLSSFQQKKNYIRAVEGELARTLMTVEYIEFASVKLKIPDPSPFLSEKEEPSASIVLKLSGTAAFNPSRAAVVANLVASAIGADPKNITIMDDKLNMISGGHVDDFTVEPLPNQMAFRKNLEENLRQKIRSVLEPAYGLGNITVAVSADLDFNKVEEQSTMYEPLTGSDTGIIRSHEFTEKTSQNTPLQDGGIAGASANLPSYQAVRTGSEQSSRTEETSEIKNYEVSQITKSISYAVGAIERLSVSVLLNAENLAPAERTDIENLVRNAINFDSERGDLITVAAQVFDKTYEKEIEEARAKLAAAERNKMMLTWGILLVVLGIAFFLLKKIMQPVNVPMPPITPPDDQPQRETQEQADTDFYFTDPASQARARLKQDVMGLASDNPEQAAKVIKSWLKE